ncbi:MAG: type II toxin-antitoxin system RelB/DinJ family antitoxin [Oscillospiraceae bacterium]|nr:type II toxin-antitoxin system RelB/DinJ family antitoxin [Oscillospiraceae bacterium]
MAKQISILIDDDIKPKFERVCKNMGLSVSSAVNMFAHATVKNAALPFVPDADDVQDDYERVLSASIEHSKQGKFIVMPFEEFERDYVNK